MRTKTKGTKITAIFLALTMLMSISTGIMANEPEAEDALEILRGSLLTEYKSIVEIETINDVIDSFAGDDTYNAHYLIDPDAAIHNVRQHTIKSIEITAIPYWYTYGVYGANAPVIKQLPNYCGPTSALQCLYALGKSGSVAGVNDNEKQSILATEMGTNSSGTIVYNLTTVLNKYSSANYTYAPKKDMTISSFKNYIKYSLNADKPAILHAQTEYLNYYNGYGSYHYIVIKAYNPTTDKIVVADCNNNSAYRGEFTVSVQEAFNSVATEYRYLIYG